MKLISARAKMFLKGSCKKVAKDDKANHCWRTPCKFLE